MWGLNLLLGSYNSMKQGKWESLDLGDVQALVEYQQDGFENFESTLTPKQQKQAKSYIDELSKYVDEKLKANAEEKELTPTELFKAKFGKKPTEVYKAEHKGQFDKADYAKWLRLKTKEV